MPEKIFQVVIYDDEDTKLREMAKATERSMSWIIRKLINREYQAFVDQKTNPQTVNSAIERG